MTDDQIIEAAIQGHASTREAIRWAIGQVREQSNTRQLPSVSEQNTHQPDAASHAEKFCEMHCSWTDHHPDCDQAKIKVCPNCGSEEVATICQEENGEIVCAADSCMDCNHQWNVG